jgi:dUTP pyrophosphatase
MDFLKINETYANLFYKNQLNDYSVLKLYVNRENEALVNMYKSHIENHNRSLNDNIYPNSGFDLFVPERVEFSSSGENVADAFQTKMINLQVKAELIHVKISTYSLIEKYNNNNQDMDAFGTSSVSAFYIYPRSSISKTPLMLANHVGIIDTGYRGNLIAAVRCLSPNYTIESGTRLFQICDPTLCPIHVVMVDSETDLTPTERGEGGFGSTGLTGSIKT